MDEHKAHVVADQTDVIRFLDDPETYGSGDPPVRFDTHGAVVFLAGDNAYKMKRAVAFPFMDLSTLAKRKTACEAEIAVNAPNAPTIYLGVVPITRTKAGFEIGGDGEPVEWLVHMRRFDEQQTLDHVAERDRLSPALLAKLVRAVLASHERAPVRDALPATRALQRYIEQNRVAFGESPELFPVRRVDRLTELSAKVLGDCWDLLLERGRQGLVRRCHGDLHLRNLVLLDGEPTLFDAVEFDDSIATGDVLYDLAFLLMDLWERGLKAEANLVLNRYLWASGPEQLRGLAALPIFLSIRATIRSKVIAASLSHLDAGRRESAAREAQQYFAAAEAFLEPVAPRLVAVGGLSGSGKTTLSAAIAPFLGRPPGAIHLRSDIERKILAGVGETERLPPVTYSQAASDAVYASLRWKSKLVLEAGCSVVVDAVHAGSSERHAIEAVATQAGVPFSGVWLDAPVDVLVDRVRKRAGDASDATEDVVRRQTQYDLGEIGWTRLPVTGEVNGRVEAVLDALKRAG